MQAQDMLVSLGKRSVSTAQDTSKYSCGKRDASKRQGQCSEALVRRKGSRGRGGANKRKGEGEDCLYSNARGAAFRGQSEIRTWTRMRASAHGGNGLALAAP